MKYFIRLLMVLGWMAIIYAFLIVPYFLEKKEVDKKTLRIYTWANRIDESVLQDFEKQTGISVYVNYYESGEELLTKIELMPSIDCDMMLTSSYTIKSMIEQKLIKPLDRAQCNFFDTIYPQFLNLDFDPENIYSIPLYWDVFGIGYNKKMVQNRPVNLDLLFDKNQIIGGQVGMSDDTREGIFLAAQYLGYPVDDLDHDQLKKIRHVLRDQKSWVGAYSDTQQGYFLATETFAVVASDRETICKQMLQHDFIGFQLLPEGSMMRIDGIAISVTTQKDELVYKFLNYLFLEKIVKYHAEKFCILPTIKKVFEQMDDASICLKNVYPGSKEFKKLILFNLGLTSKEINDFWMRFKAS